MKHKSASAPQDNTNRAEGHWGLNDWIDTHTGMYCRRDMLKALAVLGATGLSTGLAAGPLWTSPAALDEEAAYKLGMQAYVYGYPLIYFARLRYSRMMDGDPMMRVRQTWGQWLHRNVPVTPDIAGAPQTDTLYSSLWLDLRAQPYIVTIPRMDDRYWSVQFCDLFGSTFGLPSRRSLPQGGRVAVVGPDWNGMLPVDIDLVVRAKIPQTFNVMRIFFANEQDRLKVIDFQQRFVVAPLSDFLAGTDSVPGVEAELPRPPLPTEDPLADFKILQDMWQECPPPMEDATLVNRFASLALAQGQHGFEHLSPEVQRGLKRAEQDGRQTVIQASRALAGMHTANGWTLPKRTLGYFHDNDYLYRASVALAGTVALPVTENPYHVLQKDGSGALLNGDVRYTLHFSADQIPDAEAFWSLHAYTAKYTVIDNPIHRYAIGDRTAGLKYGSDGSLDIYVQAEDPGADKRANWLPVKKGDLFWLMVRAYEPRGLMKELRWDGPTLIRLG
ncbi:MULTISPECIES: DUF1254 domain-containing protein [unclassified Pseudomonas]|uniref:DUF1254 domain-containing protein n=1 Tax=unclassified Pseudomonas TaxID=196821 RepID=UPI000A1EB1F0|nr:MULTISPECIES: DUF1214 domain-containing protein [unclassified Pseudomonas]